MNNNEGDGGDGEDDEEDDEQDDEEELVDGATLRKGLRRKGRKRRRIVKHGVCATLDVFHGILAGSLEVPYMSSW